MRRLLFLLSILMLAFAAGGAKAQDMSTPIWWVDELRGGIFGHSVDNAGPGSNPWFGVLDMTRGVDANVELLFTPFDLGQFNWLGEFRPHVGASINMNGLESMAYAGLSWTWHVFDSPVFIEGTFGGSINNWNPANTHPQARNLGCNALFRESASVGVDLSENANVMLTVEHASNAGLAPPATRGSPTPASASA